MELNYLKKQCIYRSVHRGCKELDIVMFRYSAARIEQLSEDELLLYSEFLSLDDSMIYDLITHKLHIPQRYTNAVVIDFISFAQNIHSYTV